MFALVAIALLVVVSLASRLLWRRGRGEVSLVSAMISLLLQEPGLYEHLTPRIKLKLDGDFAKVS